MAIYLFGVYKHPIGKPMGFLATAIYKMQYTIISKKKSEYDTVIQHEKGILKNIFIPNKKTNIISQYEIYSKDNKMQNVRIKEIEQNED